MRRVRPNPAILLFYFLLFSSRSFQPRMSDLNNYDNDEEQTMTVGCIWRRGEAVWWYIGLVRYPQRKTVDGIRSFYTPLFPL